MNRPPQTPRAIVFSLTALLAAAAAVADAPLRRASAQSGTTIQFSAASYTVAEGANNFVTITVTRTPVENQPLGAASVDYATADGTATQRRDYTIALGTLNFAAGELSKSFDVLVNKTACACGDQTFTVVLSNPVGAQLGPRSTATVTITDPRTQNDAVNPINTTPAFVSQHYHDFLGRVSDSAGQSFWENQIESCGADAACRENARVNVSAAFLLSIEFQDTGLYAINLQRAAFGRKSADPAARISYLEFMRAVRQISEGVVIGQPGAQQRLEQNQQAYAERVVTDPAFVSRHPSSINNAGDYVDSLFASAQVTPTADERNNAISAYGQGGTAGRAAALRSVANSASVRQAEFNAALVLAGYFGYFRLNPSDTPSGDADYQSRLSALNQANGNVMQAMTVRGFITSPLYTGRFAAGADPAATPTPTPTPSPTPTPTPNTPAGTNVNVQAPAGDAQVTFPQVTAPGTTTFTPISPPSSAGAPPEGYTILDSAPAYDITTTAAYTGPVEVCLNAPSVTNIADFARLGILHGEAGKLVERLSRSDFATKTVCASVTSLSPFVLALAGTAQTPAVQFASSSATVAEGITDLAPPATDVESSYQISARSVAVTVRRSGNTSGTTVMRYAPVLPGGARCDTTTGQAQQRCDYVGGYGVIRFGPGETQKQLVVFITDDTYVEGDETFQLRLTPAQGGQTGAADTVTVTITDNDTQAGAPHPIDQAPYFVREQYIDFLRREPELQGLQAWLGVLNNCPNPFNTDAAGPSAPCDRITVASSFFRSEENFIKGYYAFRFYRAALSRRPTFEEFSYDLSRVTGATAEEVLAARAEFPAEFAAREEFRQKYGALSDADFVDALVAASGLAIPAARRQGWKDALAAGTTTRPAVLRELVESEEAQGRYYNEAFVFSLYTGFLGRDPEQPGFDNWLAYLNRNPSDFRTMVGGFVNSLEYRLRFGPSN